MITVRHHVIVPQSKLQGCICNHGNKGLLTLRKQSFQPKHDLTFNLVVHQTMLLWTHDVISPVRAGLSIGCVSTRDRLPDFIVRSRWNGEA